MSLQIEKDSEWNPYAEHEKTIETLREQVTLLLEIANKCRIELVGQIHELADHIERARGCITDQDMLKQINGQLDYALKVADNWNQNGNPFEALAATEPKP